MKYNLYINQKAVLDSNLNLDAIDCLIFDFIKDFSTTTKCKKMNDNGISYFWIKWNLIVDNMPILRINTRSGIIKRINNLKNEGILVAHSDNQILGQSWFSFGKNAELLSFYEDKDMLNKNDRGVDENTQGGVDENTQGGVDEKGHNNIYNNYNENNIYNKSEHTPKKSKKNDLEFELEYPFNSDKFRGAWANFVKYRSEIKKPFKSKMSEQGALKKLSKFNEEYALILIENSIANGWQGLVFPETEANYKKWLNEKNNINNNGFKGNNQQWNGNKPSAEGLAKIFQELASIDKQ